MDWPSSVTDFVPAEFDHPELVDPEFLIDLQLLRARLGFPLAVKDDARTPVDMVRLYGSDRSRWPDSAHLARPSDGYLARAVDVKPAGALTHEEREQRELLLMHHASGMYFGCQCSCSLAHAATGTWPALGLELATAHIHLDDYRGPGRRARRPTIFPGVSK